MWAADAQTLAARTEVATMTREQLSARIDFLRPELTEDALRDVVVAAMLGARRPLDSAALAEEQERP